jgi:hypothetical protein
MLQHMVFSMTRNEFFNKGEALGRERILGVLKNCWSSAILTPDVGWPAQMGKTRL